MNTKKLTISIMLTTLVSLVALDATTAQVRRVRARNLARGAALTSSPEQIDARHDAHQENQESRQERWNQASPNQKAVTYNVARGRHQQRVTNQANAAAALSRRRGN